jgi:hypothetical protein
MDDTSMIYGLVLLVIGGIAGIGFLVKWVQNKLNEKENKEIYHDDDSEYFDPPVIKAGSQKMDC